jgi:5-methylthioadenosine/S-adenosylhomocysteine deaminase
MIDTYKIIHKLSQIKITNAILFTMDARKRILNDMTITIKDDKIVEIIGNNEKTSESESENVIDATGMVVLPGLVNCHVHTVQTLFKGVSSEGLKLLPWLNKYIFPMESVMNPQEVYTSSLLGYAEMIRSGTTTCADMQSVRHVDKAFEAADKIGIRATIAKSMNDHEAIPETLREDASESIKESQRLFKIWNNGDNGRLSGMFGPTFIQGCSKKLLKEVSEIANMEKIGIHTHAAENLDEVKNDISRYKKRSIEILNDFGMVGPASLLAHCVHINDKEIEILAQKRSNIVHCPSSNLRLASGICSVPKLLNHNINVTLGVDGAACNDNLDLFKDMRLTALLSQISSGSNTFTTSAMDILEMVTNSGAKALGMQDRIGSIEVGKKADLILVRMNNIETIPLFSIPNQLVYSTDGHNVETVIIDGKIVLKNRKLGHIDEEKLISESQLKAKQIAEKSGIDRKIVSIN